MEFKRFGSNLPGAYGTGCCAVDIIQGFSDDPDAPASIQLVNGDGGMVLTEYDKETKTQSPPLFLGKTFKDIFLHRLRIGTFNLRDMPNHGFLAVITAKQLTHGTNAQKWLALLKENGFQFLGTVDNSVYHYYPDSLHGGPMNYVFGLFRTAADRGVPLGPPQEWLDLPENTKTHKQLWDSLPKAKYYTEEELELEGIPVWYAGVKSTMPQELKTNRMRKMEAQAPAKSKFNAMMTKMAS